MNLCKCANDAAIVEVGSTVSVIGLKSNFSESRIESVEEFKIDFCWAERVYAEPFQFSYAELGLVFSKELL